MTGYAGPQNDANDKAEAKKSAPSSDAMSQGFGFVTDEDRAKWEQMRQSRAQAKKEGSVNRVGLSEGAGGMGEIMQEGLRAKLFASQGAHLEHQRGEKETEANRQRMIDEIIQPEPRDDDSQVEADESFER